MFGDPFGGVPRVVAPPELCQNICLLNIYWYKKKVELTLSRLKNWFWGGPFGEVPGMVAPPNYVKIFVC